MMLARVVPAVVALYHWTVVTTTKFDVVHPDGRVTQGFAFAWNNWPYDIPSIVEKSTDLVNWKLAQECDRGNPMLPIINPTNSMEFYRIRVWNKDL